MSENKFTKKNKNIGIHGQTILNAGLNVFGLQLLIESFSKLAGSSTKPVEFTYLGVDIRLQVNKDSKKE